jgi:hypothetical protein
LFILVNDHLDARVASIQNLQNISVAYVDSMLATSPAYCDVYPSLHAASLLCSVRFIVNE